MTLYPEVQRKAQAEIDSVVGNSRLPDFSDQDALPYVQAVLKEVLRWHPVTPLCMFLVFMRS
jgi:cytochrome P450